MAADDARMRMLIALGLSIGLAAILLSGAYGWLSLDGLKAQQGALTDAYRLHPALFVVLFIALQATLLTLLVPGAVAPFALAAGAIMGPAVGTATVLVAVTLGDSLGFLVARYLFRAWAARRFAARHAAFAHGMARGGVAYLLALRLAAIVPYFVVNVAMALTTMRLRIFAPVSFVGLAPAAWLYVNAGVQLGRVERIGDVLSWPVIGAFAGLAAFPLAMRWLVGRWLRPITRPTSRRSA